MANDHKDPPHFITINGIDLSEHIQAVDVRPRSADVDAAIPGVKPIGPITITGSFTLTRRCGFCGTEFAPGDEGTPTATHRETGFKTPICPTCFIALQDTID